MLKGFKDFLMRGNVVELATAVIIGAAFTAIVTAFTEKIVNPLIASIPISTDYAGLGIRLRDGMPETFVDFGAVITALINFVIVAAVVYFLIVMPYNKLSELRKLNEGDIEDDEVSLLTEIRDLLDPQAKERKAAAAAAAEAAKAEAEAEEARLRDEFRAREEAARLDNAAPQPGSQFPEFPEQPQQPNYGQPGATQQFTAPPQAQQPYGQQPPAGPPSGGFPTPNPAPGQYPPPGNLPPGQYAPGQYPPPPEGGQFPQGQFPNDGPRHSR